MCYLVPNVLYLCIFLNNAATLQQASRQKRFGVNIAEECDTQPTFQESTSQRLPHQAWKIHCAGLPDERRRKKVIIVKHPDHGDDTFEILPGNCCLDCAGPPNQFFIQAPPPAQQGQQQPAVQQNVAGGEQEEEVADEAVADGQINQFIPPTAAHGWAWEEFRDSMTTDWRGAAAKSDAHMLIGGLQARDMSPIHFFDAFFPYEYVCDEVIPATNNILKERDARETTMEEMKIFFGSMDHHQSQPRLQCQRLLPS